MAFEHIWVLSFATLTDADEMKYGLSFLEDDHTGLLEHLRRTSDERAAFLLCRKSVSEREIRLLVRQVIPVLEEHVASSSNSQMAIKAAAYVPLLKRADDERLSLVFVHSHPPGFPEFSKQDDHEEQHLFRTIYSRVHHEGPHGSLVLCGDSVVGRVQTESGEILPLDRMRIVGKRFRFIDRTRATVPYVEAMHRQALAFGESLQPLLYSLHVGVVGAGGTGSAVLQQLVRLGIGEISIFDPETFDATNVNRVYGSALADKGALKVDIAARAALAVGLKTQINKIPRSITFKSTAQLLRDCDVVLGCTDDEWGRSILTNLAVYYGIPVIDMGVNIDTDDHRTIRSIDGRVTLLMPGTRCLFCRKRIDANRIAAEVKRATAPEEAEALAHEGYIAGVPEPAPAVIPFTTGTASFAVSEFLARLTGFMDPDRDGTELLCRFDQCLVRSNLVHPDANCFCGMRSNWMKGDQPRFLNLNWRSE